MKKKTENRKNVFKKLTYLYIRRIKKWMFCPACQQGKMIINKKSTVWICEDCGYKLSANKFEDDYVFWFCDECGIYLNNQEGFSQDARRHICKKCGYENDTTFDNVKGICSDCGKIIPDPDGTLCIDCKKIRKEKAKEWLKEAGKFVGATAILVGSSYLAYRLADDDENQNNELPYNQDSGKSDSSIFCDNCGNTDESSLFDQGDTIYCSRCYHRTRKDTGEDDSVECPYCHRMRDRTAMYCRWCNDTTWEPSTQEEFEETDKILSDLGYGSVL